MLINLDPKYLNFFTNYLVQFILFHTDQWMMTLTVTFRNFFAIRYCCNVAEGKKIHYVS